jgi:hypothetical protein
MLKGSMPRCTASSTALSRRSLSVAGSSGGVSGTRFPGHVFRSADTLRLALSRSLGACARALRGFRSFGCCGDSPSFVEVLVAFGGLSLLGVLRAAESLCEAPRILLAEELFFAARFPRRLRLDLGKMFSPLRQAQLRVPWQRLLRVHKPPPRGAWAACPHGLFVQHHSVLPAIGVVRFLDTEHPVRLS